MRLPARKFSDMKNENLISNSTYLLRGLRFRALAIFFSSVLYFYARARPAIYDRTFNVLWTLQILKRKTKKKEKIKHALFEA